MQVFKLFCQIFKKNLKGILIYIVVFVGIAVGLTMSVKEEQQNSFQQSSVKFVADNQDEGELGAALVQYLDEKNDRKDLPEGEEALTDAMYNREIDYVLSLPKHFSQDFMDGKRDGLIKTRKVPSSQYGTLMDTQITQYMAALAMYTDSGFSVTEAVKYTAADMGMEADIEFLSGSDGTGRETASYYFQYLAYIFVSIVIAGLGATLMTFRRKEIQDRNQCSSMPLTSRNLQIMLGCAIATVFCYLIFMIVAFILYRDYLISARGILSMINAFVFILFCLSLAFLASQLVKGLNGINMISTILGLGLAFLGGVFVPVEMFSDGMLKIAMFIPTYWYVTANDGIQNVKNILDASRDIYIGFGIQLAFAAAVMSLGLLAGRMKARQS